ncbi:hypothetical protein R1sor_023065 [Riccia sorocarpa]|uniref:SWIM-type domain-containing protein n=1 Tax=Riccia sorocarpa TaxID=122646 RepID=A0ABD3GQT2_9MARC
MAVNLKDVLNIQQALRRYDPGHAADDAVATRNWTKLNPEKVLFYQEPSLTEGRPFMLAWQTEWMLSKLASLGHGSTISIDATFGTNKYGFQLFTVVCFDAFQNGLPCLWVLMERHEASDLVLVLSQMKERVNAYRLNTMKTPQLWQPSCFLVDDAKEENLALREVFPDVPVNLCLWHVRRAWLKKLHSFVKDPFGKAEMNRSLGRVMYCSIEKDPWSLSMAFMDKFKHEKSFVDYYERHWHGRIDRWAKGYRAYAHANQDSQGSIERWHATLKQYLRGSRKEKSSRRVVWLVMMLTERLEPFYYCTSELKEQGHIRNRIVAKFVIAAIKKAREIPDTSVIPCPPLNGLKLALVSSSSRAHCFHEVHGWDKDSCTCTCGLSVQGNVCKHRIKCLLLLGGHSEVALLHRLGTKWGTHAGGLENMEDEFQNFDSEFCSESVPVVGVDIPLSVSSDSDDDCVILPVPTKLSAAGGHIRSLAQFQKEVGKLYAAVSHSRYLCTQAFEFLLTAVHQALQLKASMEVQDLGTQEETDAERFVAAPGTDGSLKRKKDFLEKFQMKRKKHDNRTQCVRKEWTEIDADNQFRKVLTVHLTTQEALDRATHETLDLNVSFSDKIDPARNIPPPPTKRNRKRTAFARTIKQQVVMGNEPNDVIVID